MRHYYQYCFMTNMENGQQGYISGSFDCEIQLLEETRYKEAINEVAMVNNIKGDFVVISLNYLGSK